MTADLGQCMSEAPVQGIFQQLQVAPGEGGCDDAPLAELLVKC